MVRKRVLKTEKAVTDIFGQFCRHFFISIFGNFGTKKEPRPTYPAEVARKSLM